MSARADGPSARSLRGLDGINFLMADVRDGVGPYLSVFLKGSEHWDAGAIGLAMAASSIAAAICQVPAGLLVDGTRAKRLLVAIAGLIVAAGCLLIVFFPRLPTVLAGQAMLGAASAVIPPAIAAMTLGLVGRRLLDSRVSRNEGFNHAGNLLAAVLAGTLGKYLGYHWIFFLVCGFAVASALIVTRINPREIDHDLARGGEDKGLQPIAFRQLFKRRDLMIFLAAVVLFHFGNAAMLPMAGQVLAQTHPGSDTIALSACIIAAQFVMVGVAWCVGRASAAGVGRKPIFLLALAVLPVRGLLFCFASSPIAVVLHSASRRRGGRYFWGDLDPDSVRPDARYRPLQPRTGADSAGCRHRRHLEQCHGRLCRAVVRLSEWIPLSCRGRVLRAGLLRVVDA